MTNDQVKAFALALLYADSEDEVIEILTQAGFWDDHSAWRLYGDKEGNFASVGNQQSLPEAALVEKDINCVDSRLMLMAALANIDPVSPEAPVSVRDAVAMFFENSRAKNNEAGSLLNWGSKKRTEESRNITMAATGGRPTQGKRSKRMCLTICDQGEGQSPDRLPHTILSLNAKNKQRIRFVQGKFNMGGSGALRFCGNHGMQLVISRRHPELAKREADSDPTAGQWAVTVVRREEPSNKRGDPIHSEFTYLAPRGSSEKPRNGEVMSFDAETLPLMPIHDDAYKREVASGTAIKLYEYQTSVGQSNVLMKGGLLFAMERLMPEIALPIRLHECRNFKGVKERSFETPISGLVVRLEDGRGDNLEEGFPHTAKLLAAGTKMTAKIYAFKEAGADTYLRNEGVIFQINGQAHGYLPKSIFARKKVGLPRLRDSLLVVVDCSGLTATQREDLFMSSRDRLSEKSIRYDVEAEIMEMLQTTPALADLQQVRRNKEIESKLSDDKPLEEVLGKVMKSSPTLRTIFLAGLRLSKPFAGANAGSGGDKSGEGDGSKTNSKSKSKFIGKKHPSFFDLKGVKGNEMYRRSCEIGRRFRLNFKTDVENEYFARSSNPGLYDIEVVDGEDFEISSSSFVLDDGDAFLSCKLPEEAEVGDVFVVQISVNDPTLVEPFVSLVKIRVMAKQKRSSSKSDRNKKKASGSGDKGSGIGISTPNIIPVKTDDEKWQAHKFTPETSCHVESDPVSVDGKTVYEHSFYINVHNTSLQTEMKHTKQDVRVMESKFIYANVLMGLAMIYADEQQHKGKELADDEIPVNDRIRQMTQAVAPVLLPMIDQLSGLDQSELEQLGLGDSD